MKTRLGLSLLSAGISMLLALWLGWMSGWNFERGTAGFGVAAAMLVAGGTVFMSMMVAPWWEEKP
jgi:hypothetical protein